MPITSDGKGGFEVRPRGTPSRFPAGHDVRIKELAADIILKGFAEKAAESLERRRGKDKTPRRKKANVTPKKRTQRVCFWCTPEELDAIKKRIDGGKVGEFIRRQCMLAPLYDSQTLGGTG